MLFSDTLIGIADYTGEIISPATTGKQDDIIQAIEDLSGFDIPEYDEIAITYVTVGNGIGEIYTVVYKKATVTVGTLTLGYNSDNKLISVIKT